MIRRSRIPTMTDSYKFGHYEQYAPDTTGVFSYWESRQGAHWPKTTFFGLQYLLKEYMDGPCFDEGDVERGYEISRAMHGEGAPFPYREWLHIANDHDCRLPLRIKAVPEGMAVPVSNVMMTVENTCPRCYWLTNYVETMLARLWHPTNVATLSGTTVEMIRQHVISTGGDPEFALFMLHDFGARGASSHESAALGGAAHLIASRGTDTVEGIELVHDYYDCPWEETGKSVPATEHSVMASEGRDGEMAIVDRLIEQYPRGILSVVGDTYDINAFVEALGEPGRRERIMARDGKFVVRPDSGPPVAGSIMVLEGLHRIFGGEQNRKGYRVLDPHVGSLWGDGIDPDDIDHIGTGLRSAGFAMHNMVFGMGGGLHQKHNRDTQSDAFKASAIERDGEWHDVYKDPIDGGKVSKRGRLKLMRTLEGGFETQQEWIAPHDHVDQDNVLRTVFEDGELIEPITFAEVRANAAEVAGGLLAAQL